MTDLEVNDGVKQSKMYTQVQLVKNNVYTVVHRTKRAYMYTHTFTRRKECICWKIKEIQEETILGVNTMVLAHNIERSNDYLIPPKNTTGPKWFWSKVLRKA